MAAMKAIRTHEYGGPEVIIYEEVPRPEPAADEVLIHVQAAGVNPVDWKIREGFGKEWFGHQLPLTLGCDLAGIVESTGNKVTALKPGDAVLTSGQKVLIHAAAGGVGEMSQSGHTRGKIILTI